MENDIMMAAMQGDHEKIQQLVDQNVPFDQADENGRTPLMAAVFKNLCACAEILINAGADVNAKDNEGYSVLYYAAAHGHFTATYLICTSGVKLDKLSADFINTVGAARENGFTDIAQMIIEVEAKQNAES
jgi:ankyrin repeat protein